VPYPTALEAGDPGQAGHYRLARRIAGMPGAGPAYLGISPDGSEVTVTLLPGGWTSNPAARDRFAAEAAGARQVPPYCAARILDAGIDDSGQAFLVSEHVSGESLAEAIAAAGPCGAADLAVLAIGAVTGLASVHQAGLVHGSFSPDHLVLGEHGPTVIQFGVTPPYGPATPAADVLAWARTMVFAAAGRPLAGLADLDLLPEPLRQLATDCLSTDPQARPDAVSVVGELLGGGDGLAGADLLASAAARASGRERPPGAHGVLQPAAAELAGQQAGSVAAWQDPPQQAAQHQAPETAADQADPWGAEPPADQADPWGAEPPADQAGPWEAQPPADQAGPWEAQPPADQAGPWEAQPPAGGPYGRHQPADRSRAVKVVWAAVAVIIVLAVSVLVHVMQNGGSPRGSGSGGGGPAVGPAGGASAAAGSSPDASRASPLPPGDPGSPAPAAIPRPLAGLWAGQVSQGSPAVVLTVRISLPAGQPAGRITYSGTGLACTGRLSLVSAAARAARLRQSIVSGKGSCAGGMIRVRRTAARLSFVFRGHTGPSASGTLTLAG
jgi:hypothetical protein